MADRGGGRTVGLWGRAGRLRPVPTFPVMPYAGPEDALAAEVAGKPPEATYITIDEVDRGNWAKAGRLLD